MEGIPEGELFSIQVSKVILPNGELKRGEHLDTESTVKEEKERILKAAKFLNPDNYVMVLQGPNRSREVLDDTRILESYMNVIGGGDEYEIYIEKKRADVERPPRPANTQMFNVNLK